MMDGESLVSENQHKRWQNIRKVCERTGPFSHPNFEASPSIVEFIMDSCKVLIVGAGGLGCELLKDLALMGFKKIHVVDMDTIELSNLNRQFLFRKNDIGLSKAKCAVEFVNKRIPGIEAVAHHCAIQDLDEGFYRQFHIVVCGLDSIVARRWLNGMLVSLLLYNDDRSLDQSSIIPIIDGGTEGFKGNARVILPGMSPCIECTLDLYPPQKTFPLCTIANTPRLPEHCVEYIKVLLWAKENPWGATTALDGDDPQHVAWVYEKAQERAIKHGIANVTYRLTQGVLKNIIPAVASTNAAIAAACATEVFKLATSCCVNMNNYMVMNMADGVYTYTFSAEKRPDCVACSNSTRAMEIESDATLQTIYDKLCEDQAYMMKSPGITTVINGRNKTLYMSSIKSIEERTRDNLKKKITELGLYNGADILVADVTTPNTITIKLKFAESVDRSGKQSQQNHLDASRRRLNAKVLSDPNALTKGRAAMDAKWLTIGLDLPDYTPKVAAAARAVGVPISLRGVGAAVVATYSRAYSLAPQKVAAQCSLPQAYRACLLQVTCKLSEQNKAGSPSYVRRPDNAMDVFMAEDLTSLVKSYMHSFPLIANIMSGIGWFQVGADSYRTYLPDRGVGDAFSVTADRLRGYVDAYNRLDEEAAAIARNCNSVPWQYDGDFFVDPDEVLPPGWPNRGLALADFEAFDGLLTFLERKYMRVSEVNYEPKAACHSLVSREIDMPGDCGSVVFVGQTAQFTIPYDTVWHSRTALDGQTWARGVLSLLGEGPPDPLRSPVLATSILTADWQDFATSSFGPQ